MVSLFVCQTLQYSQILTTSASVLFVRQFELLYVGIFDVCVERSGQARVVCGDLRKAQMRIRHSTLLLQVVTLNRTNFDDITLFDTIIGETSVLIVQRSNERAFGDFVRSGRSGLMQ